MTQNQFNLNLDRYDIRLINANLETLITSYYEFEERVVVDLIELFIKYLEAQGAESQGNIITIADLPYKLTIDPVNFERVLTFYLTPCGTDSPNLLDSESKVDHFGRIRTIRIRWPEVIKSRHEQLLSFLQQQARNAYIALRVMFTSRYSELERSLLRNLYEILNIHIDQSNKPELAHKSYFTVTSIDTGQFLFFFSRDRLDYILKVLSDHQASEFSPFELAVCLITDESIDSFIKWGVISTSEFKHLPVIHLDELKDNYRHWIAGRIIFQDPSISVMEICKVKDHSLQLNCPSHIVNELEPIATLAADKLTEQFQKNFKEYSVLRKAIAKLTGSVRQSGVYEEVKDIATDVLSKTIGEILKP